MHISFDIVAGIEMTVYTAQVLRFVGTGIVQVGIFSFLAQFGREQVFMSCQA
jgi:hypothetical protein